MMPTDHITPDIRYLRRHEIDAGRWDDCVRNGTGSVIYGHSYYLDNMAGGQWDALVWQDYQAVMPLTWRSKAGIRYCYQPAFTQQTGIFSRKRTDSAVVGSFLRELDRHFRFAEICLNYGNAHPALERRTNFILALDGTYEDLSAGYRKDLVRNLKAADASTLAYVVEFDWHTALRDFRQQYASRLPAIKEKDYRHFETLCSQLWQQGHC